MGDLVCGAKDFSAEELNSRTLERRAVEAVIWGMPAVNYDVMLKAMRSQAKGDVNQIVHWSRLPDWKNQTLTPNPDSIYVMPFIDTKGPDGYIVLPSDTYQTSAKHLGAGQFYLMTFTDHDGNQLDGAKTYRLTVPPNAPVTQYWSATAYDRNTHALIRDQKWSSRSYQSPDLQKNADGSVDVYFGPRAPEGKHSNWVPTSANGEFEVLFRLYGPQKPLFDKSWLLPDIEKSE